MRIRFATLVALFLFVLVLVAPVSAQGVGVKFNFEAMSSYVAPVGLEPHDGTVAWSDLTVSLPRGFYANLWGSTGTDFKPNGGREIDWTGGWSGKGIDVGVAWFDFDTLFSGRKGDVWRFYSKYSREYVVRRVKLAPYGKAEYFYSTRSPSENSAHLIGGGMSSELALSRLTLALGTDVSHVGHVFGNSAGVLWQMNGRVSVKVKRVTLNPFIFKSSVPIRGAEEHKRHFSFGAGFSIGG